MGAAPGLATGRNEASGRRCCAIAVGVNAVTFRKLSLLGCHSGGIEAGGGINALGLASSTTRSGQRGAKPRRSSGVRASQHSCRTREACCSRALGILEPFTGEHIPPGGDPDPGGELPRDADCQWPAQPQPSTGELDHLIEQEIHGDPVRPHAPHRQLEARGAGDRGRALRSS